MKYTLQVNGQPADIEADSHYPLLWALRDDLKLTGTKFGCGIGECAICLVDVDGTPTHACITPVSRVAGKQVVTIEGLANNGKLTDVQQAWIDEQVPQCGWCQPAQVLRAEALLRSNPTPSDKDIDDAMFEVYCRCGTYPRIRCAIKRASGQHDGCDHPVPAAAPQGPAVAPAAVTVHQQPAADTLQQGLRFGTYYRMIGRGAQVKAGVEQMEDAPSPTEAATAFTPNVWITVTTDGTTVIECSHSEQGQGILTSVMAVMVDEADSDWDNVQIYMAPLASETPYLMHSITGGFTMLDNFKYLRHAGATVRAMMKAAAAQVWSVPVEEITTHKGVASHAKSGRQTTYADLVPVAKNVAVPTDVPLKSPDEWQLIGKWIPRVDVPAKVDGSAIFPMDIDLPGMLVGVPVIGYTFGSTSWWYDDSATLQVPGVKQVVKVPVMGSGYPEALVVVADSYHAAYQGALLLQVDWNDYPANQLTSDAICGKHRALANQPGQRTLRNDGNVEQGFAGAEKVLERYFQTPYVAHLPMSPLNAVAHVHDGKIEVWAGLNAPLLAFGDLVIELGLTDNPENVVLHQTYVGGSFGRTNEWDHVIYAVMTSAAVGAPVKLIYDRATDTRQDKYHEASGALYKVGVGKDGKPVAWQIHKVSADFANNVRWAATAAWERTPLGTPYDPFPFRTLVDAFAYDVPNFQVQHTDPQLKVPTSWMRGVGAMDNNFAVERMMDDLAELAGVDSLQYRKSLIKDDRLLACLDSVVQRAQWGKQLPPGSAQGVSVAIYDKTRVACIVEATVSSEGAVRVDKITTAVDPGVVIDPGSVHGQVEGGTIFGLSNLLYGGVDIVGGGTVQANLDTTKFVRMNEVPEIDIGLISTDNPPGALGEPGSLVLYGALANALSRASGARQYSYPFRAVDLIPSPNP
ncbi:MAG TPA: molybdopterin cofactor-binding domain-containing protein [Chloroflexota bacterium]|jgi:isoquinoline 1-oxidoreductase beta subunit